MDEKGNKLYTIKSSAYLPIMSGIIGFIALMIACIIHTGDDFKLSDLMKALIATIPAILIVTKFCMDLLKNIEIYERCIIIGKKIINYEDIKEIVLKKKDYDTGMRLGEYGNVGSFENENFLQISFKDGVIEEFIMSNYSLKQVRTIVECIEQFTKCDVSQAKEFLDIADTKHRKDLTISAIIVVVFVIISIIFIKTVF